MKHILLAFILINSISSYAQDTLRLYKNGNEFYKIATSEIDSAIFYKPNISQNTVQDIDGNIYTTVTIGTQTWMAENLKTTKYNDGGAIQLMENNAVWEQNIGVNVVGVPYYCWYNNDISNKEALGALYTHHVVQTNKICPVGWHVPSRVEINELILFLGGPQFAGKLKQMGTTNWQSPNTGATNETGFNAIGSGLRAGGGFFGNIKIRGSWWASDAMISGGVRYSYQFSLDYDSSFLSNPSTTHSGQGRSIRCIQD